MSTRKKIKICFIDFYAYSLFNPESKIVFGGAQVQLFLLSRALSKNPEYEIVFVTDDQKEHGIERHEAITVHKFLRSSTFSSGSTGMLFALLTKVPGMNYIPFFINFLEKLRIMNADIYIQRAAGAETGIIALISKLLGKRFIYMVAHDFDVSGEFVKRNGIRGKLFNLGIRLADAIVCQSNEQLQKLPSVLKKKTICIKSAYPLNSGECSPKAGVLWVGRSESWKQPELFLDLAEAFPREQFTMIAPPADSNPKLFQTIKERAGIYPNVRFIERVPFGDIDAYFKAAKIFVSTSTHEGFPNTFIQAVKNKTPLLSLHVNPDSMITRHNLGFHAKGNMSEMISSLKILLENNELWKKYSEYSFRYAEREHNIQRSAEQYKKLFSKVNIPHRAFTNAGRHIIITHGKKIIAIALIVLGIFISIPTVKFFFASDPHIQETILEEFYGGYVARKDSVIKNSGFEPGPYGWYLAPQKTGEFVYRITLEKPATDWSWLYLGFYGAAPIPGSASISTDGTHYTPLWENTSVSHIENKASIGEYIRGRTTFYLKFDSVNQSRGTERSQVLYKMILKVFAHEPLAPPSPKFVALGFLLFVWGIALLCSYLLGIAPIATIISAGLYARWLYLTKIIYQNIDADAFMYKLYAELMSFRDLFGPHGFYSGSFIEREPFFILITKLFFLVVGSTETHIRLLTLVLSLISIYLMFLIGKHFFGIFIGLLGSTLLAFNIPYIIDSTRGMRLELEIVLILLLVWVLFCIKKRLSPLLLFSLTGCVGGAILLTRSINLFGVVGILASAALIHSKDALFKALQLFVVSLSIAIALFIPHKYGMYLVHGDYNWDVNHTARWEANVEFAGKPGFPSPEEVGRNPYQGPRITPYEYLFKLHTVPEVLKGTISGFYKIFINFDLVGYGWLVEKYTGIAHTEILDTIFQILGIIGLIAIFFKKRSLIWVPLGIGGLLLSSAFFYDRGNLIEKYRHTFQAFPLFVFPVLLVVHAILRRVKSVLYHLQTYELIIRKDGKEKIIRLFS